MSLVAVPTKINIFTSLHALLHCCSIWLEISLQICHEASNSGPHARQTLRSLIDFIEELDLSKMRPDAQELVVGGPKGALIGLVHRSSSDPKVQEASTRKFRPIAYAGYLTVAGVAQIELKLAAACGGRPTCR